MEEEKPFSQPLQMPRKHPLYIKKKEAQNSGKAASFSLENRGVNTRFSMNKVQRKLNNVLFLIWYTKLLYNKLKKEKNVREKWQTQKNKNKKVIINKKLWHVSMASYSSNLV